MSWKAIERELVDIFRGDGHDVDEYTESGDKIVKQGDLVLLNITEIAKELSRRGIGQGTPR